MLVECIGQGVVILLCMAIALVVMYWIFSLPFVLTTWVYRMVKSFFRK